MAVQYAAEQARGRHGQLSRAGGAAPVPDDEREAKQLTSILPVVLEKNGYEAVYDAMWWYKLKFGTGVQGVFWNPRVDNGAGTLTCAAWTC